MPDYLSLVEYTSNGSQKVFPVPFPYINKAYVKVYSVNASNVETELPFSWETPGTIALTAPVPQGMTVKIVRTTYNIDNLVDYFNVSQLGRKELNLSQTQLLHLIQETSEYVDFLGRLIDTWKQRVFPHASTHAYGGEDPVSPPSIGAPWRPPNTGKPYLGTHTGWIEYQNQPGGIAQATVLQVHYFTTDGVSNSFTVHHTLNSLNVTAAVYLVGSGRRVLFGEQVVDENTIILEAAAAEQLAAGTSCRVILTAPGKIEPGDMVRPEYVHEQSSAAASWAIQHNLGNKYPMIKIVDTSGDVIIGAPDWANANENFIRVDFYAPTAGRAIISL